MLIRSWSKDNIVKKRDYRYEKEQLTLGAPLHFALLQIATALGQGSIHRAVPFVLPKQMKRFRYTYSS